MEDPTAVFQNARERFESIMRTVERYSVPNQNEINQIRDKAAFLQEFEGQIRRHVEELGRLQQDIVNRVNAALLQDRAAQLEAQRKAQRAAQIEAELEVLSRVAKAGNDRDQSSSGVRAEGSGRQLADQSKGLYCLEALLSVSVYSQNSVILTRNQEAVKDDPDSSDLQNDTLPVDVTRNNFTVQAHPSAAKTALDGEENAVSSCKRNLMKTRAVSNKVYASYQSIIQKNQLVCQLKSVSKPAYADLIVPLQIQEDCAHANAFDSNPANDYNPHLAVLCLDKDPNRWLLKLFDVGNEEESRLDSSELPGYSGEYLKKDMCIYTLANGSLLILLFGVRLVKDEPVAIEMDVFENDSPGARFFRKEQKSISIEDFIKSHSLANKEVKWPEMRFRSTSLAFTEENKIIFCPVQVECWLGEFSRVWTIHYFTRRL